MENNDNSINDLTVGQIYKDIINNNKFTKVIADGKEILCLCKTNIYSLQRIESFVQEVIETEYLGFDMVIKNNYFNNRLSLHYKATSLGRYLDHLNFMIETVYEYNAYYIYSENVMLFNEACHKLKIKSRKFGKASEFFNDIKKSHAELFNDLIELIRLKSTSAQFKKRIRSRDWNYKRRHDSMTSYVNSLFSNYASMLVIRIDLAYPSIEEKFKGVVKQDIRIEQVNSDFQRFLENMRHNKIFEHKIGHIWKIEYAEIKGYHYHWIFFFNGAYVQRDHYIGNLIGKCWKDVATKGRGIFFNCNSKKAKYHHLGIGKIHASHPNDAALRYNLFNYVIKYLTKRDQFLEVKLGIKQRSFSTGAIKEKSNVGKPRKVYDIAPDAISQ